MSTIQHTALIAGVTGAIGGALARELVTQSEWQVLGLSRREPTSPVSNVTYLQIDMDDASQCEEAIGKHTDITHIFYCGRATHAEQVVEDASANVKLLDNLINAAEQSAKDLAHVHLVQGGKVYGVHVGPFVTPAREDQPRVVIDNFNYDQEDFLRERSKSASWSWSASRPNTLVHFSPSIARNLVSSLGAYVAISREAGAALDFPGPQGAYNSLTQLTNIELLARAIAWMSTEAGCANQAFNVTNTDLIRWKDLWPKLADASDMPLGVVRPLKLSEVMANKQAVWSKIVDRYGLQSNSLDDVANWSYLDATLERYWDEILSHNKIRQHGFHEWGDSERRVLEVLNQYRETKILPK